MMKTLVLVLALAFVVGGGCVAATATIDVYTGWNLIAAPLVPFSPDPLAMFAGVSDGIDGLLFRNDPSLGGIGYDGLDPSGFGNVLLGDGFWLNVYATGHQAVSYEGVADGVPDGSGNKTDMWISLPGNQNDGIDAGGWHLIGQPFAHNTPVDPAGDNSGSGVFFTDGTTLKTWNEAVLANWVDGKMSGNEAATGGFNVQYDGLGDTDTLQAAHGYWLCTFKDNLALIIPAN